jgi:hypothetical protein
MYCKDLTSRKNSGEVIPNVFNVGWLLKSESFKTGSVNKEFLKKLKSIYFGSEHYSSEVNLLRAPSRQCNICGVVVHEHSSSKGFKRLGHSEIWIAHKGKYYAAPSLIIHYIESHDYLPPKKYVKAVLSTELDIPFNAADEELSMLKLIAKRKKVVGKASFFRRVLFFFKKN